MLFVKIASTGKRKPSCQWYAYDKNRIKINFTHYLQPFTAFSASHIHDGPDNGHAAAPAVSHNSQLTAVEKGSLGEKRRAGRDISTSPPVFPPISPTNQAILRRFSNSRPKAPAAQSASDAGSGVLTLTICKPLNSFSENDPGGRDDPLMIPLPSASTLVNST